VASLKSKTTTFWLGFCFGGFVCSDSFGCLDVCVGTDCFLRALMIVIRGELITGGLTWSTFGGLVTGISCSTLDTTNFDVSGLSCTDLVSTTTVL